MLTRGKHHPISEFKYTGLLTKIALGLTGTLLVLSLTIILSVLIFEAKYQNRIYPGVQVAGIDAGGMKPDEVEKIWNTKNQPFKNAVFEFRTGDLVATVSGTQLDVGFDANLSAMQAYLIGRSGSFFTDLTHKYFRQKTDLSPLFRWKEDILSQTLDTFSETIDVPAEDALFSFSGGKVTEFKPSKNGLQVNRNRTLTTFRQVLEHIPASNINYYIIPVSVDVVKPIVTTDSTNSYGIKEQIGRGYSEFSGSIPGRIHNVALAASRFNGVLIAPGESFSFNKTLGDVSAATGYQQAYIIKEGRTVLGDGGGVCQVSTTLFRAAMDAGLPITERHAHAYRVHYYEEGGYPAGMDATVFDPSDDLKFKNDTPGYILIQTKTDTDNLTLEFNLYGQSDGRKSEIYGARMWGVTPPPPDLFQDDPTLKVGVTKQVDFSAWGANAAFKYKVTRDGKTLLDTEFISNYRPWQAIYLKGTMP
jgi:vancomycin resistance protein YoaR